MRTFSRLSRFFSKLSRPQRGFTIIELLVVTVIIVLITAFVLFRQQGFNSSTLLRSLSYSIALSVRQAQVYGVSVRESAVGSGAFAQGYGVYFGNTNLPDEKSAHYVLFADTNNDGQYITTEAVNTFKLGNGRGTDYRITNFCVHVISGGSQCGVGTSPTITWLTVYFRRPNPDGCFAASQNTTACAPGATPVYDYAYVQLQSMGSSDTRTVKVTSTGQIEVCPLNADPATC